MMLADDVVLNKQQTISKHNADATVIKSVMWILWRGVHIVLQALNKQCF